MIRFDRLRLIELLLAAWAALVVARMAQVQLVQHTRWEAEAKEQRERVIEIEEPRGDIRTRDGRVLAGSLERLSVGVNPRRVPPDQRRVLAQKLSPLVNLSEADILERLSTQERFFYLAKDLDPGIARKIARLGQDGIWTERSERRVYPHGGFAGPVIGFVDGEGTGQAGIEAAFESTLRGVPSVYHLITDGRSVGTTLDLRLEKEGRAGISLTLTIDSEVQAVVEDELNRTITEIGARGAAAVVLDPATGEVLALASLPTYDPGKPGQAPPEGRHDRAVEDALEPGSTFKPIMVAAALTAGVITPYDMIDCSGGGVQIAGFFIHDHARYGLLPVREVIAQSSNAGAIRIAQRMSPAQLDAGIQALGFGRKTGIELPAETSGIYRSPEHWSALSRAGLALGQEISASPLQIAQGYAAIANGGVLIPPRIVLETIDERTGQAVTPYQRRAGTRVLSPEIARAVTEMLGAVVDEGTGKSARVAGYHAAGKTGTAQEAVSGSYAAGKHAAWFAGFLPREHPRLVIVVCVDRPEKTYWAADVAAPAFGRIGTRLMTLLGIAPVVGEPA